MEELNGRENCDTEVGKRDQQNFNSDLILLVGKAPLPDSPSREEEFNKKDITYKTLVQIRQ
jgi:hypothetical protein